MRVPLRLFRILAIALVIGGLSATPGAVVQTGVVVVATTPTLVWTAPAGSGRVLVRNPSTVTVFLGPPTVTTATGFPLAAGDAIGIVLTNRGTLYGVVATATATVNTLQGDNTQ